MLSNNDFCYAACAVRVSIFSTGGKFRPVSNFTKLHVLTLAACSYALLVWYITTLGWGREGGGEGGGGVPHLVSGR